MRKILRALGLLVGGLFLLAFVFALYIHLAPVPRYAVPRVEFSVDHTSERVDRGRRLARMTCVSCHMDPATGALTGRHMTEAGPEAGPVYTKNLTAHPVLGIGAWSDGELAYMLRTGVRRDGQMTPPWMPKLVHMSDEDLKDIIAFLRSADPLVQAKAADDRESEPSFLVKFLFRVAFKPQPWPPAPVEAPPPGDVVAFGRYLVVGRYECYSCHSPDFSKVDTAHPERTPDYLGGSNPMHDTRGHRVFSANLTPDAETGIGKWTEAQFKSSLQTGRRADGTPMRYPMIPMPEMSDAEAHAIFAYLRTVPAVRKARGETGALPDAGGAAGRQAYFRYGCASCHGESGAGLYDLRAGAAKYATDSELVAFLENPQASRPGIAMPSFAGAVPKEEILALAGYVRTLGR